VKHYVGLDVSMKETVCVVNEAGERLWRGTCASTPEAIAGVIRKQAPAAERIGLETGMLCTWHFHVLKRLGLPVVCIDARHAKAALTMQINKTDANDAEGLEAPAGSAPTLSSPCQPTVTYGSLCQRREGVLPGGVDETRKMEHPQCRRLRRSGAYQQRSV
jgi:transposase